MKLVSGMIISIGVISSLFAAPAAFAGGQNCVDGSVKSNLSATLKERGTIEIATADGMPLCNDVTLNFSSYTLPDNYNGKGFTDNATAIPQTQFSNTVVTLERGMTKPVLATVSTPPACKATQIDLYYGPNQTQINTSEGILNHEAVTGKVYNATESCATATTVQPTASVTPTAPAAETTRSLPSTGASPVLTAIGTSVLAVAAYGAVRLVQKSSSRNLI